MVPEPGSQYSRSIGSVKEPLGDTSINSCSAESVPALGYRLARQRGAPVAGLLVRVLAPMRIGLLHSLPIPVYSCGSAFLVEEQERDGEVALWARSVHPGAMEIRLSRTAHLSSRSSAPVYPILADDAAAVEIAQTLVASGHAARRPVLRDAIGHFLGWITSRRPSVRRVALPVPLIRHTQTSRP
jgi:hypothetical protein